MIDGRQPVRLLAPRPARGRGRSRRGGRQAPAQRRRRPLRPALRPPQVRQDEPAQQGAPRRGAQRGPDPGHRRPLPRVSIADVTVRLERAYAQAPQAASFADASRRSSSARARPLARRVRDQRAAPARPGGSTRCPRSTRCSTCRCGSRRRRVPGARRLRRVPGHRPKVDGLDGLLRSHIQHQGDVATYVFAGSEPGLMRQLFETEDRPLYGSAVPMRLGRLADADIAEYVAGASSGRSGASGRRSIRSSRPRGAIRSARCSSRTGCGTRSRAAARRRSRTGTRRTRRRCASSTRSSTRSGAASTRPSRRRSARSSSATGRRTAPSRCGGSS